MFAMIGLMTSATLVAAVGEMPPPGAAIEHVRTRRAVTSDDREGRYPSRPGGWTWSGQGWWSGAYRPPVRGYILPSVWLGPDYRVDNWWGYGLARPAPGLWWVRYYDDALLVDRHGMIRDLRNAVDWNRYDQGAVPDYVGGGPEPIAPGRTMTVASGSVVTLSPGETVTLLVQSQPVTHTTTTYSYESARPYRRVARGRGSKLVQLDCPPAAK